MSSSPTTSRRGRALGAARLAWAAALLVAPGRLLALAGGAADRRSIDVARILGARHAIQGTVELTTWPRWRRTGVVVDVAHALTAALLAGTDRSRRRVARVDTAAATSFALAALVQGPSPRRRRGATSRRPSA